TDLEAALGTLATLLGSAATVAVSTSCSTLHVPYNVWRTDLEAALGTLATLLGSAATVAVSTSCSTLHVPY
ncbi:hypothetical protein BVW01_23540, partial [Mycobacterium tuberculosis]